VQQESLLFRAIFRPLLAFDGIAKHKVVGSIPITRSK